MGLLREDGDVARRKMRWLGFALASITALGCGGGDEQPASTTAPPSTVGGTSTNDPFRAGWDCRYVFVELVRTTSAAEVGQFGDEMARAPEIEAVEALSRQESIAEMKKRLGRFGSLTEKDLEYAAEHLGPIVHLLVREPAQVQQVTGRLRVRPEVDDVITDDRPECAR